MTGVVLSLLALLAFGYLIVGPTTPGSTPLFLVLLVTFRLFMYLFIIIVALIIGGAIEGRQVAPLQTEIIALGYAAAAALVTGLGAGWYRKSRA